MYYCVGKTRDNNSYFILDKEDNSVERISYNQLRDLYNSGVGIKCFNPNDNIYKILMHNKFDKISFGYRFDICSFIVGKFDKQTTAKNSMGYPLLSIFILDKKSGYDYRIGNDFSFVNSSYWYLENRRNYGYSDEFECALCFFSKDGYENAMCEMLKDYDLQKLSVATYSGSIKVTFAGWIVPMSYVSYIIKLYDDKDIGGLISALGMTYKISEDKFWVDVEDPFVFTTFAK